MEVIIFPLRIRTPFKKCQNSCSTTNTSISSKVFSNINISEIEILQSKGNLIQTNIPFDDEPSTVICTFLSSLTPQQNTLRGKRAISIPPIVDHDSNLYCVPVDYEGPTILTQYTFTSVEEWMNNIRNKATNDSMHPVALRIKNWLHKKQDHPGALPLLFCDFADDRFKYSIINPGFPDSQLSFSPNHHPFLFKSSFQSLSSSSSPFSSGASPSRQQLSWREKVVKLNRCNILKTNPLFGSHLSFKYKVDRLVTNRGYNPWRKNVIQDLPPQHLNNFQFFTNNAKEIQNNSNNNNNYKSVFNDSCRSSFNDTNSFQRPSFISSSIASRSKKAHLNLHHHVNNNDITGVMDCIKKGHSPLQEDEYFDTALHLSAEKGHVDILRYLLDEVKINVNSVNHHKQSLLHIACANNQINVLNFLLERDVNLELRDKNNMIALDMCTEAETNECYAVLKRYIQQPSGFIDIRLMNDTHQRLMLPSHADTTVKQLHRLLIKELKLPDDCISLFSIWICSKNLHLQLKDTHRPIQQLNDWKSKIIPQWSDHHAETEDPELFWRRDVLLSIKQEQVICNSKAIELLFAEAYMNYSNSFYLCSEDDVIFLAGILMQISHGNYKENNEYLEKKILDCLPSHLLPTKTLKNWCRKILIQYKHYSSKNSEVKPNVHQEIFLRTCRTLITYGCAFFVGNAKYKNKTNPITVGINDVGCHIIDLSPRRILESFKYSETDWHVSTTADSKKKELKLRRKGSKKDYVIISKQVGLMDRLMQRLSDKIFHK